MADTLPFGPCFAALKKGDEVALITLGDGVWQVYGMKLARDKLTLSGGDLEKPVTLRRVGPPTPRADSIPLPPPPPASERAWD